MTENAAQVAIIGAGNIGLAMADGLVSDGVYVPSAITLVRRQVDLLQDYSTRGFVTESDSLKAIEGADIVIVCLQPKQILQELKRLATAIKDSQVIISVATGVSSSNLSEAIGHKAPVVRAMPNTAVRLRESMTCLSVDGVSDETQQLAINLFDCLGSAIVIEEKQMTPATALCACGVAFFLRAIRAASQGGIEIGFHAEEALAMAAQTARGAATLLLESGSHPEREIDKVTTPMGCTIAGLNQMEHDGFSSALIRGIVTSAKKAGF